MPWVGMDPNWMLHKEAHGQVLTTILLDGTRTTEPVESVVSYCTCNISIGLVTEIPGLFNMWV